MSVILMITLFYKALILQGEIWCWSLFGPKGLREHMERWFTQGSSGRRRIDPFTRYNFSPYWDCVTSCNQIRWIDHGRLDETEQQSAIFKVSYVQTLLYKLALSVFFKPFFNASVRITLWKLKLKAICFSLFIVSEVKALKTCPGFAISDCTWGTQEGIW